MKRPLVIIALLLLIVGVPGILLIWESFRPQQAEGPRGIVQSILSPVARLAGWASDSAASGLERFVTAGMVREENALLKEELTRLQSQNARLNEELAMWKRLHPSLELAERAGWSYVAAQVVAFGERHWLGSLVVNRGSEDGIKAGDPAIYMNGLAGLVVGVTDHTATVHLLNDPETAVLATVLPIRARGLVKGTGRYDAQMTILLEDPSIQLEPGYQVITSGLRDSLYPRGLIIGKITGLSTNRFGQPVGEIQPAVRFRNIEEVLILKTTTASGNLLSIDNYLTSETLQTTEPTTETLSDASTSVSAGGE